ncbi:ketoacyl-ACP synthase III [Holzapfeliella sp. He02]|uniref:Beta-ketoacyl-[acyl-carrier-protein] synthase III n=1 Tax=Holzapfeliella saturejae TaxID=3082953 RepID=A0ABU8SHP7_9LACO
MKNFSIEQTAHVVPENVVTNNDLTAFMETSDEWISKRTGIKQRHISNQQTTSDLCLSVAENLITNSQYNAEDIDLIIVATMSPDYMTPNVASMVQGELGATNAMAFDINTACSGFVYGLKMAHSLFNDDKISTAIVIGGEVLSKLVDFNDRSTAILFGDGAGGALITKNEGTGHYLGDNFETYGDMGRFLTAGHFNTQTPFNQMLDTTPLSFEMNGRKVYDFATSAIPESLNKALEDAGLDLEDIDHFIFHQANARIIKTVVKKLKLDPTKAHVNIDRFGNTAAASEPILLDEVIQNGTVKKGQTLALIGFGGGLEIGTVILNY